MESTDGRRNLAPDTWAIVAIALVFLLWASAFIYRTSFEAIDGNRYFSLFDDAMVSMRYAWNLAHGLGPVWNPGEAVEGYTNPLMVLLMAVAILIFGKYLSVLAIQIVGVLLLIAIAYLSVLIADEISRGESEVHRRLLRVCAFLAGVAYYPLVYWTLMGMETGLLTFLLMLASLSVIRTFRKHRRLYELVLPVSLGLAYLTRPDSIVPAIVILAAFAYATYLSKGARTAIVSMIIVALLYVSFILIHEIFRWSYYGELVPNTYVLKAVGMPFLDRIGNGTAFIGPFLLSIAPVIFLVWLGNIVNFNVRKLFLALTAVSIVTYQVWIGGDAWVYWRIMSPFMPLLLMMFAHETLLIVESFSTTDVFKRYFLRAPIIPPVSVTGLVFFSLMALVLAMVNEAFLREAWFLDRPYQVVDNQNNVNAGIAIKELTTTEATVGVAWAGSIPYYTNRTAVDFLGKSDPHIARLRPDLSGAVSWNGMKSVPGHNKYDLEYSIRVLQPTYVQRFKWGSQDLSAWGKTHYVRVQYQGLSLFLLRGSKDVFWDKVNPPSTGLVLWLDASKITGFKDGDSVGTWLDRSGKQNDAEQRFSSEQPVFKTNVMNGKPVLRFDGIDDWMNVGVIRDAPGGIEVFVVNQRLKDQVAGPKYQRIISSWDGVATDDFTGGSWAIQGARDDPGNPIAYGPDIGTSAQPTGKGILNVHLGNNAKSGAQLFSGDIGEIIIYDTRLATEDRDAVTDYLNRKWGLTRGSKDVVLDVANPPSTGLILWLDASGITGLKDGDSIGTWLDRSGKRNDAEQSIPPEQPIFKTNVLNGRPVLRFDGIDDWMNVGAIREAPGGIEVFVVNQRLRNQVAGPKYQRIISSWDGVATDDFRGGSWAIQGARDDPGNPIAYGPDIGTSAHSTGKSILDVHLGNNAKYGTQLFSGDIGEIIIYDKRLTTEDRDAVTDYLNRKWGLTPTLSITPEQTAQPTAAGQPELFPRRWSEGLEIYSGTYVDTPFMVRTRDGNWLVTLTLSSDPEGGPNQHIVSMISTDKGDTWSGPVEIESPSGPESSWAMPLVVPSGRIYVFYTYNFEDRRSVKTSSNHAISRVDTQGALAYKFSDDDGESWSLKRFFVPIRTTEIDRLNPYGGEVKFFWAIGKPVIYQGDVIVGASKVGSFGKGFIESSEGVFFSSNNMLTEPNPDMIEWQMLPRGDIGLRAPDGPISEEHDLVVLSDGTLYSAARSSQGYIVTYVSTDGGETWTRPQYATYMGMDKAIKNPRARVRVFELRDSRYLLWFHNHSGTDFKDRNPAWLSGGLEKDGTIEWSQPEIVLYDERLSTRISYPDLLADDGDIWLVASNKTTARLRRIDPNLINGLFTQWERGDLVTKDLALSLDDPVKLRSSELVELPKIKEAGFSIGLWVNTDAVTPGQMILSTKTPELKGVDIFVDSEMNLGISLSDGITEVRWSTDPSSLKSDGNHYITFIVDGEANVLSSVVDGVLSDGGPSRQFGFTRIPDTFSDADGLTGLSTSDLCVCLKALRIYDRSITTSEAIANYKYTASFFD